MSSSDLRCCAPSPLTREDWGGGARPEQAVSVFAHSVSNIESGRARSADGRPKRLGSLLESHVTRMVIAPPNCEPSRGSAPIVRENALPAMLSSLALTLQAIQSSCPRIDPRRNSGVGNQQQLVVRRTLIPKRQSRSIGIAILGKIRPVSP